MFHIPGLRGRDRERARERTVSQLKIKNQPSRQRLGDAELAAGLGFGSEKADEKPAPIEKGAVDQRPQTAGLVSGSYTFWSPWSR